MLVPNKKNIIKSTAKKSYFVDDNGIHYFEYENTPLSNFTVDDPAVLDIVINGVTYNRSKISTIVFGDSYSTTKSIPDNFLRSCASLRTLDWKSMVGVMEIGASCVSNSPIRFLDFSTMFRQPTIGYPTPTIGNMSFYNLHELRAINLGSFVNGWSNLYQNNFAGVVPDSSRIIFHDNAENYVNVLRQGMLVNLSGWSVVDNQNPVDYQGVYGKWDPTIMPQGVWRKVPGESFPHPQTGILHPVWEIMFCGSWWNVLGDNYEVQIDNTHRASYPISLRGTYSVENDPSHNSEITQPLSYFGNPEPPVLLYGKDYLIATLRLNNQLDVYQVIVTILVRVIMNDINDEPVF